MTIILMHYLNGVILLGGIMLVVWLLYLITRNPGVVDLFWGLGLALAASIMMFVGGLIGSERSLVSVVEIVLFVLVWVWCLRLSLFLFFARIAKKEKDARYLSLAEKWQNKVELKFLINFLFQAFLQSFIFMSLLPLSVLKNTEIEILSSVKLIWIGFFLIGLIGQTTADLQLYRFKQQKSNQDKVCDIGLWKYSRHPNYFFEWIIWLSISVFSLHILFPILGWLSVATLLAPVTLLVVFFGFTIGLTETQALKKRPESYRRYQENVSVFIPWFNKGV